MPPKSSGPTARQQHILDLLPTLTLDAQGRFSDSDVFVALQGGRYDTKYASVKRHLKKLAALGLIREAGVDESGVVNHDLYRSV